MRGCPKSIAGIDVVSTEFADRHDDDRIACSRQVDAHGTSGRRALRRRRLIPNQRAGAPPKRRGPVTASARSDGQQQRVVEAQAHDVEAGDANRLGPQRLRRPRMDAMNDAART